MSVGGGFGHCFHKWFGIGLLAFVAEVGWEWAICGYILAHSRLAPARLRGLSLILLSCKIRDSKAAAGISANGPRLTLAFWARAYNWCKEPWHLNERAYGQRTMGEASTAGGEGRSRCWVIRAC